MSRYVYKGGPFTKERTACLERYLSLRKQGFNHVLSRGQALKEYHTVTKEDLDEEIELAKRDNRI